MLFGENATTASVGGGYSNASRRPIAGTLIGHGSDGPNDSKLNKWTMPRSSNQDPSFNSGFRPPFNENFWGQQSSFYHDPHFPVGKTDFSTSHEQHQNRHPNAYSNPTNLNQSNGMFPPGDSVSGVPPQWSGVQVNQTTPWDVGNAGGGGGGGLPPSNPSIHQWNSNPPSVNKWETKGEPVEVAYSNGSRSTNQQYGGGAGTNNYMSQPQQMVFEETMSNPISMPYQPFNPNQHLWMNQNGMEVPFGRNEHQRGAGGPFNQFNALPLGHPYGPPPMIPPVMGHPGMMQPQNFGRSLQQNHHANPPPGMMHHQAQHQQHHHPSMGTFGGAGGGTPVVGMHHPPGMHAENDSVWQDPDGSLKKWQRDTGTALWGDPIQHNEQSIQRWQQFSEEEEDAASRQMQPAAVPAVVENPNSARGGSKPLLGWGDPLPPDERAPKSGKQSGNDAWKPSNEPKEFGMQQRRNTGFDGMHHQNEWETPSTSSNVFPISSSLGAATKHQSVSKVSLAEELSAMGLEDITGNGESRKPEGVGTSLW